MEQLNQYDVSQNTGQDYMLQPLETGPGGNTMYEITSFIRYSTGSSRLNYSKETSTAKVLVSCSHKIL